MDSEQFEELVENEFARISYALNYRTRILGSPDRIYVHYIVNPDDLENHNYVIGEYYNSSENVLLLKKLIINDTDTIFSTHTDKTILPKDKAADSIVKALKNISEKAGAKLTTNYNGQNTETNEPELLKKYF